MLPLDISTDAHADIQSIIDYLNPLAGVRITARVVSNIFSTFDLVAMYPNSGTPVGVQRRVPCRGNASAYLCYWKIDQGVVVITRVIRGERQSIRDTLGDA